MAKTLMFAAVEGVLTGVINVADPIRDTSIEAIGKLHALGLEVIMLTGATGAPRMRSLVRWESIG